MEKKEIVDLIIKGKYIITMSNKGEISRGAIAIRNSYVVDVGSEDYIFSKYRGEVIHEYPEHIVMPGLVDCHVHTQQLFLRSSITDYELQLPPIWTKYLIPFEKMLSKDLAYLSSLISFMNMIKNGITFFVEAGAPYPEEVVRAAKDIGIKGVVTASTFNVMNGEIYDTKEVINNTLKLLRLKTEKINIWCSIRQLMMCTEDLIESIAELCRKYKVGLILHLAEYQGEIDFCLSKYGLRSLEYLESKGLTKIRPFIAAHALYLSPKEIDIVKRRSLGICWCPTVDAYLMGHHWLSLYADDVVFSIGSDGGAFSTLDLFHEAKIARAISKAFTASFSYTKTALNSRTLLRALTGQGGSIIGQPIGKIDKGYKADIIAVNTKRLQHIPLYNPIEALVNFIEGSSVDAVYIDGNKIMDQGTITTIDENNVIEKLYSVIPLLNTIVKELKKDIKLFKI